MSSFLAFIAISLKFVRCTESVRQTSSKEMAKNYKKGDMVKIFNHCTYNKPAAQAAGADPSR